MVGLRGIVISCYYCGRPVETVVYSERARREGFRGYSAMADDHVAEYGCYPDRAFTTTTRDPLPQRGE